MSIFTDRKDPKNTEINRLQKQMDSQTAFLRDLYAQLGEAYANAHADDTDGEYASLLADIRAGRQTFEQMKAEITALRGQILCPECGAVLPADAKFCINCGAKIPERVDTTLRCNSCGSPLLADAKFCTVCGTPVAAAAPDVPAAPVVLPEPEPVPVCAPAEECENNCVHSYSAPYQSDFCKAPEISEEPKAPKEPETPEAPASRVCSRCGAVISSSERFCTACGQPVTEAAPEVPEAPTSRVCPRCGAGINSSESLFCTECGQRL